MKLNEPAVYRLIPNQSASDVPTVAPAVKAPPACSWNQKGLSAPLPPATICRLRIEQPAAGHGHADARRVADVLERVGVEDDEVGELAGLEAAEVRSRPSARAGLIVPVRSASMLLIPPSAKIQMSQCAPRPSRWPWAPIETGMPRSLIFLAATRVGDEIILFRRDSSPAGASGRRAGAAAPSATGSAPSRRRCAGTSNSRRTARRR